MSQHGKPSLVLVVEDDADIADLVRTVLEEAGYVVDCARNASGALRLLGIRAADVVLLDCHLPGGGMSEVLARADAIGAGVVLMSGHSEMLVQLAAFGYPCLYKPFHLEELSTAISRALRNRAAGSFGYQ